MEFSILEIKKINDIVLKLESFKKEIIGIDYIHDKVNFFRIMREFRKYLVEISVGNNFEIFNHSKYYKDYKEFFTGVHEYYLRSLESMQAISVMTKGIHGYSSFSELMDRDLLRENFERKGKELDSIDYSNSKNFVSVGSGPFPETMLYVCENSNLESVLGLDFNHEAIYMAGEMISGLGIKNISFKQCDAREFDYSNIDIVSIPLFVSLKNEVIEQIIKTGKDNVQIIVTLPKGFLNLIYEGMGKINSRLKISNRDNLSTEFVTQEMIKLEKYDF